MMSYLQCHSILFCSVAFYSFLLYSILYPVSVIGFEESPNGFGRNGLSSNGTVLTDDGIGASRGHKVGRTRGVKGAKKVLAVAAALRVSRTMEPRVGGKRKGESFLVLGKRKTYEGEVEQSDVHSHLSTKYYSDGHSRNGGSSSSTTSSSSERSYAELSKQNLSAAEIKLEKMQKIAQEKAEKVRKVVEEKASKIRKQAEEKANKLRCLADEKVIYIFDLGYSINLTTNFRGIFSDEH